MLLKTFHGGAHPPSLKSLTENLTTEKIPIPKRVVIPLSQHTGSICEPVISVGDTVKKGDLVGKSDKFISSPVHASVAGRITGISPHPHPVLGSSISIEIESAEGEKREFIQKPDDEVKKITPSQLLEKIKQQGIVGMGGAAFPTHVKLSPPKSKPIDTLILNGAECEPYITCDHRLMLEKPLEILKGLEIMVKILGVKNVFIAIEDNKKDAIGVMKKIISVRNMPACPARLSAKPRAGRQYAVISLHTKYPQGAEKQLIKVILNKIVPAGGLPMDVGCVVHNVGTAYAVYEAIYLEKPLIERYITITGDCIKKPLNLLVPIGTLVRDIVEFAGGIIKDIEKLVIGGPMMGFAQYTMEIPVIKGTNGILVMSKKYTKLDKELTCIRCSRCIDTCPVYLMPTDIMRLVKKEKFEGLKSYDPKTCMECGVCAYECPSKIPLVDYIKFAKTKV